MARRFALNRRTPHGHALAPHNASYKPYRTDFADATRAVLRLVERHSRHSTTALNRQSLSSLFLLFFRCRPLLFCARSLAIAFYFQARSTRLAATQRDATRTRRDSRRPLSSTARATLSRRALSVLRIAFTFPSATLSQSIAALSRFFRPATVHPSW